MAPKLVIFDCDGVLVDSETLGNRAIAETAQDLGLALTFQESIRLFRGLKMAEIVDAFEVRLGRRMPDSFVPELRARMAVLFRAELRPVEGVEQAIDGLPLPYCVASNAPREKIRLTLGVTGLLARFDGRIFSAYDVNIWKPDPGLYLHAARSMGADPEVCIVIEDSAPGVEAAVAAGMRVYGFAPAGGGRELADRGAELFSTMAELPTRIGLLP
jgi:HAD superfamily hydrolase (TIGR01509 family)